MSYTECSAHGAQVNVCKLCARDDATKAERERVLALVGEIWKNEGTYNAPLSAVEAHAQKRVLVNQILDAIQRGDTAGEKTK